jgi:hypothetical protein
MNERIKELALQAGYLPDMFGIGHWDMPECIRFVELVRQDEREACAKVCESIDAEYNGEDVLATWCAKAIRARGNT